MSSEWTPEAIQAERERQAVDFRAIYPGRDIPERITAWAPAELTDVDKHTLAALERATFEQIVDFARANCDGHFVLMRFTSNWRLSFAGEYCFSRYPHDEIADLPCGATLQEAFRNAREAFTKQQ